MKSIIFQFFNSFSREATLIFEMMLISFSSFSVNAQFSLITEYLLVSLRWFNDTLKAFDNFKTKHKSVGSNVFWYGKVWIFWKCIQYTIHWDKTKMLKKFPLDKINGKKISSFFFHKLQLITVLLLICNSYMSWSARFVSLKLCVWFSILDSFSFLLKFIFLFNKMHGLFDFKTS